MPLPLEVDEGVTNVAVGLQVDEGVADVAASLELEGVNDARTGVPRGIPKGAMSVSWRKVS